MVRSGVLRSETDSALGILRSVNDLDSASVELDIAAGRIEVPRLMTSAGANLVRLVGLPQGSRILQVGVPSLAAARFAAEQASRLDVLVPDESTAVLVRARCRDLDTVNVHIGGVAELTGLGRFDVVLAVGTLAALRPKDDDRALLSALAGVLDPDGALILSATNRYGVAEIASTNAGAGARTDPRLYSRGELETLIADAGLQVRRQLMAFPDDGTCRAVIDHSLATVDKTLMWRIPRFPVTSHAGPEGQGAATTAPSQVGDQGTLWRQAVMAGLDLDLANSWVVIAGHRGAADSIEIWPSARLAAFASIGRIPAGTSTVLNTDDGVVFRRRPIGEPPAGHPVQFKAGDEPYRPGVDLLDLLPRMNDQQVADALARWAEILRAADFTDGAPVDLVPHNLIVDSLGTVQVADDELRAAGYTVDMVLQRGCFWLAARLVSQPLPAKWSGLTIGELAEAFGTMVGLEPDWLAGSLAAEASLQAAVAAGNEEHWSVELSALADRPVYASGNTLVAVTAPGKPVTDEIDGIRAQLARAKSIAASATARERNLDRELNQALSRNRETLAELAEADRRLATASVEIAGLTAEVTVVRRELIAACIGESSRKALERSVAELTGTMAALTESAAADRAAIAAIRGSTAYAVVSRYRAAVEAIAPQRSPQRRLYRALLTRRRRR